MNGQMHPNYFQITILLVVDLSSSLAYFMMTQPLLIASKLPIKTLVARQLPTNMYVQTLSSYMYMMYTCCMHCTDNIQLGKNSCLHLHFWYVF